MASVSSTGRRQAVPSKTRRVTNFGIDCAETLTWTNWEPGGEYTKKFVIKNVSTTTHKVKYRLPKSHYFSMEYPETIILSAGTSLALPVTFRPMAMEPYNDKIELVTQDGSFTIPITAKIPKHSLACIESLVFGMCPAKETTSKTFALKNTGDLPSHFEWDISSPFAIFPRAGIIEIGASQTMTVKFSPQDASVFDAIAVCKFGGEGTDYPQLTRTLSIEGVGKYPFLDVFPRVLDFGQAYVGQPTERSFRLKNTSQVLASYRISSTDGDGAFIPSLNHGTLLPGAEVDVAVTFSPEAPHAERTENFEIVMPSGRAQPVACRGAAMGPSVSLLRESDKDATDTSSEERRDAGDAVVITFKDVALGGVAQQVVHLENTSGTPASFQFVAQSGGVFDIDTLCGTLPARSSKAVQITFRPPKAINYYRRVYCLVQHQQPLAMDLIATCFSQEWRPHDFRRKHLVNYRRRCAAGLGLFSPEQLTDLLDHGRVALGPDQLELLPTPAMPDSLLAYDVAFPGPAREDGMFTQFYRDASLEGFRPVTIDEPQIDFGACRVLRIVDKRIMRVTNNTRGVMICAWMVRRKDRTAEKAPMDDVFVIEPSEQEIGPGESCIFKVGFNPQVANQFYGIEVEGYAYFRSMRTFRLVNDATFTPPWCVTAKFTGHTFPSGVDSFVPKVTIDASVVSFTECIAGDTLYRTVVMRNEGDTPSKYELEDSAAHAHGFSVQPRRGILQPNQWQLLAFRFTPTEARRTEDTIRCRLNDSAANVMNVEVNGTAHSPSINLEAAGAVYFKPTCMGGKSTRQLSIKNTSAVPTRFRWVIPRHLAHVLSVTPAEGVMQPRECQTHLWDFVPPSEGALAATVSIVLEKFPVGPAYLCRPAVDGGRRKIKLRIVGEGTKGLILADPAVLDLGTVMVNHGATRDISLFNPGDSSLHYELIVDAARSDNGKPACDGGDGGVSGVGVSASDLARMVELSPACGTIGARANVTLRICVRPAEQQMYSFTIKYRLEGSELQPLCDVVAMGVYPTLTVTDCRCPTLSKGRTWKLFSLDRLNHELATSRRPARSPIGRHISFADTHDARAESPTSLALTTGLVAVMASQHSQSACDLNFGPAVVGSDPTMVMVRFENTGMVPVDWSFLFPSNLKVEVDKWAAVEGDPLETQAQQAFAAAEKIFSVKPKSGRLAVGDHCTVMFRYVHGHVGTDRLPVILKLEKGRQIMLNLCGHTLAQNARFLHVPASHHWFYPIAIGDAEPPVQTFELHNAGTMPLDFELDLGNLERVRAENHNFSIFECRSSGGSLRPGDTAVIPWIFRPLEARSYDVDVPVRVVGGESAVVTFSGVGYHPGKGEAKSLLMPGGVPVAQGIPLGRQQVHLSQERVEFGDVPLYARSRRLVFVTNNSKDDAMSFRWVLSHPLAASVLEVTPSSGMLAPGASALCRIVFLSVGRPQLYDFDIECHFDNMTEVNAHRAKVEDVVRKRHDKINDISRTIERSRSPVMRLSLREWLANDMHGDLRMSKYDPLPPIASELPDEPEEILDVTRPRSAHSAQSIEFRRAVVRENPLPTPPKPTILCLGIMARTHVVDHFRDEFAGVASAHFVSSAVLGNARRPVEENALVPATTQPTANIIADVLGMLVREVIGDADFGRALDSMVLEPTPYFKQYAAYRAEAWPSSTSDYEAKRAAEQSIEIKRIKCLPEFQSLAELVLENTLLNIIGEASVGKFQLTVRSRAVAPTATAPATTTLSRGASRITEPRVTRG